MMIMMKEKNNPTDLLKCAYVVCVYDGGIGGGSETKKEEEEK